MLSVLSIWSALVQSTRLPSSVTVPTMGAANSTATALPSIVTVP
jgi:hypothetical protein